MTYMSKLAFKWCVMIINLCIYILRCEACKLGKCSFLEDDLPAYGSSGNTYKKPTSYNNYTGSQVKIAWVLKIGGKIVATAKVKVAKTILQEAPMLNRNHWSDNARTRHLQEPQEREQTR